MSGKNWPVYKGESFDLWEPDTGTYYASADPDSITGHLHKKRRSQHRKKRSAFSGFDQGIIEDPTTLPCHQPRIAFRNVTNPTNSRTMVCCLVPGQIVIANAAPYLLLIRGSARHEAFVLGVLSSMILDWNARRVVELNLNFFILNNLPIPDPEPDQDPIAARVVELSGRLAAVDERFAEWAAEVGVPVGSANDPDAKRDLIHELDACVALLYGLDEDDLAVIYETFDHKDPNRYAERHAAVLEHYRRWRDR